MSEMQKTVLSQDGYEDLIVHKRSDLVYEGTVLFCRRFLSTLGDRTVDEMTQAAWGCRQNVAEGSASSGTSKETEIQQTLVPRMTLGDLMEDYLGWLKSHDAEIWSDEDMRRLVAREIAKEHQEWSYWKPILESGAPETVANLMLTLCHQALDLLNKAIEGPDGNFKTFDGVRERMHAARGVARGESWDKTVYSSLDGAASADDLQARAREIRRAVEQAVVSIARQKGWGS